MFRRLQWHANFLFDLMRQFQIVELLLRLWIFFQQVRHNHCGCAVVGHQVAHISTTDNPFFDPVNLCRVQPVRCHIAVNDVFGFKTLFGQFIDPGVGCPE